MMLRVEKDFNSTSAIHVDPQVRGTKTDSAPEAWQQAKHIAARKDAAILPLGTVAAPARYAFGALPSDPSVLSHQLPELFEMSHWSSRHLRGFRGCLVSPATLAPNEFTDWTLIGVRLKCWFAECLLPSSWLQKHQVVATSESQCQVTAGKESRSVKKPKAVTVRRTPTSNLIRLTSQPTKFFDKVLFEVPPNPPIIMRNEYSIYYYIIFTKRVKHGETISCDYDMTTAWRCLCFH